MNLAVEKLEQTGHVIAERLRAGGETQALTGLAAQFGGDLVEVLEERRNKLRQLAPGGGQREGTALEQASC